MERIISIIQVLILQKITYQIIMFAII